MRGNEALPKEGGDAKSFFPSFRRGPNIAHSSRHRQRVEHVTAMSVRRDHQSARTRGSP